MSSTFWFLTPSLPSPRQTTIVPQGPTFLSSLYCTAKDATLGEENPQLKVSLKRDAVTVI